MRDAGNSGIAIMTPKHTIGTLHQEVLQGTLLGYFCHRVREFGLELTRLCVSCPLPCLQQGVHPRCAAIRTFSMHRAARSATADHVRALLQQLLFVHRVKLLAMRLQYQLEETMDDLDDIGFDEQVLSGVLRTAHLEISGFIARCDRTMLTTEQRILRLLLR